MSNGLPQPVGYGIVALLGIVLLWLFAFGGVQTIFCDWLLMKYLAVCG